MSTRKSHTARSSKKSTRVSRDRVRDSFTTKQIKTLTNRNINESFLDEYSSPKNLDAIALLKSALFIEDEYVTLDGVVDGINAGQSEMDFSFDMKTIDEYHYEEVLSNIDTQAGIKLDVTCRDKACGSNMFVFTLYQLCAADESQTSVLSCAKCKKRLH